MALSPDEKKIHRGLQEFADVIVDDLKAEGYFEMGDVSELQEIPASFWSGITKASWDKNESIWPSVARVYSSPALDIGVRRAAADLGTSSLLWHSDTTRQYFEQRGLQFVKDLTTTDRIKLKAMLFSHFGDREEKFAKFVKENSYLCDGNFARLKLIKRTETHTATEGGAFLTAYNAGAQYKEWHTAGDNRVRERHRQLEGNIRHITQPFDNGLLVPGEPNCRCFIVYSFDRPEGAQERMERLRDLQAKFKSGEYNMSMDFTIPIDMREVFKAPAARKIPQLFRSPPPPTSLTKFTPATDIKEAKKRIRALITRGNLNPVWQLPGRAGVIRYKRFAKDGANIGKVKEYSLELSNIVIKKLEEFELRCKNLGIPPIRGLCSPQSSKFAGQAGDGLLGLNIKVQEDRLSLASTKSSLSVYEDMVKTYKEAIAKVEKELAEVRQIAIAQARARGYGELTPYKFDEVVESITMQATTQQKARLIELKETLAKREATVAKLRKKIAEEPIDWHKENPGKTPYVSSELYYKREQKVISDLEHEFAHHIHEQIDLDPNNIAEYSSFRRTTGLEPIIEEAYIRQSGPNYIKDAYPTLYSNSNSREWFAENYTLYMMNRKDLVSPLAKPIIEEIIERQGQGVLEL